jgi:hypothetical protein
MKGHVKHNKIAFDTQAKKYACGSPLWGNRAGRGIRCPCKISGSGEGGRQIGAAFGEKTLRVHLESSN